MKLSKMIVSLMLVGTLVGCYKKPDVPIEHVYETMEIYHNDSIVDTVKYTCNKKTHVSCTFNVIKNERTIYPYLCDLNKNLYMIQSKTSMIKQEDYTCSYEAYSEIKYPE